MVVIQKTIGFIHTGLTQGHGPALWTGLNSLDASSGWHWINGQPFRYLNWLSGNY